MNIEQIVSQIAQTLQKEANVNAIFGEPRKLDEHTIIPVARVEIKLSGGGGMGSGTGPQATTPAEGEPKSSGPAPLMGGTGGGGGGGLEVEVRPLGFIRDGKDGPEFVAIDPTPEGLLGKVEHLVKNLRGAGKSEAIAG